MNVTFEYNEKTIEEITNSFYLNILTPKGLIRENIAVAIKHLYFYTGLSRCDMIENEKRMLYRQIIILSYSTIEALIISVAYMIQTKCRRCDKCQYRDVSLFQDEPEVNRRNAFYNADKFLRKVGILNIPYEDLEFYSSYRHLRNEIHLIDSSQILTNEKYTDEYCKKSIDFLKRFFKYMKENYIIFKENTCTE